MFSVQKNIIVPFSSKKMYDLINDVESYPQFLIWCEKVKVLEKTDNFQKATLIMRHFSIHLTTENIMINNKIIDIKMVEGPFKSLKANWMFEEITLNSCKIYFSIEFYYKNFILEKTLGPVFNAASDNMVNSFSQRAKKIYLKT